MGWDELYSRLRRDPNDGAAWGVLEACVWSWACGQLREYGWVVIADVVDETCATVVIRLDEARWPDTFQGFAYGYYLDVRRRLLRREEGAGASVEAYGSRTDVSAGADADQELGILEECHELLPGQERRAIDLRYFEEAGFQAIAAILGISEDNARRLVFSGLARLRRHGEQLLIERRNAPGWP